MVKIDIVSEQLDNKERITLGLLNAVHENESLSQRSIASDLSIALGMANAYLNRCIKKGFIKVKQAPANRYLYYLTPQGFSEKSRLTAEYLSQSMNLFRVTRQECERIFETCLALECRRVALLGNGDLVEIFVMSAPSERIEVCRYSDSGDESDAVSITAEQMAECDAAIICDMRDPLGYYRTASARLGTDRVFAPRFLGLDKMPGAEEAETP